MIVWWCLLRYKPKAESMREIIDRPNFVRIKNFCSAKKQCQGNEKVSHRLFANDVFEKYCYPKYTKNSSKLNNKKTI